MGKFRFITILAVILVPFGGGSGAAAQPNALTKFLNHVDRGICRTYRITCKTHAKPVSAKRKNPTLNVIEPTAVSSENKATPIETTPAPPIPVQKPSPARKAVVSVSPKFSSDPPISTQRPARASAAPAVTAIPRAKPLVFPKQALVIPRVVRPDILLDDNIACLQRLRAAGAEFTIPATNIDSGSCHVENPINLNSVKALGNSIELPESPLLNRAFALQFSKWLKESGVPSLTAQLGSPLKKIATGPGYECRGLNGDSSAKISEHGFGNALDIATLGLQDGRTLNVEEAINPDAANSDVWHGLRASACGYFTTVLGPGSNSAHEKHFHFDMGVHGKSGNYRICE